MPEGDRRGSCVTMPAHRWVTRGIVAVAAAGLTALFVTWWIDGLEDPAAEALDRAIRACYLSGDTGAYVDRTPRFTGETAQEALAFYVGTYEPSAELADQAQSRDQVWSALATATAAIVDDARRSLAILTESGDLINAAQADQQLYIAASEAIGANVVLVTETCNSLRIYLNEQATASPNE